MFAARRASRPSSTARQAGSRSAATCSDSPRGTTDGNRSPSASAYVSSFARAPVGGPDRGDVVAALRPDRLVAARQRHVVHGQQQLGLAPDAGVDGVDRHPGQARDVGDRRAGIPRGGEQLASGDQHRTAGGGRLLGCARSSGRRGS